MNKQTKTQKQTNQKHTNKLTNKQTSSSIILPRACLQFHIKMAATKVSPEEKEKDLMVFLQYSNLLNISMSLDH